MKTTITIFINGGEERVIVCDDERQEIAITTEEGEVTFWFPSTYATAKKLVSLAALAVYRAA